MCVTASVDVFVVSSTDLQEKNNFCFHYNITKCKVAPLVGYLYLANCYKYQTVHVD